MILGPPVSILNRGCPRLLPSQNAPQKLGTVFQSSTGVAPGCYGLQAGLDDPLGVVSILNRGCPRLLRLEKSAKAWINQFQSSTGVAPGCYGSGSQRQHQLDVSILNRGCPRLLPVVDASVRAFAPGFNPQPGLPPVATFSTRSRKRAPGSSVSILNRGCPRLLRKTGEDESP